MSNIHPSVGEGRTYEEMLKFWDDYSDQYSAMQQGDIPKRVVDSLFEKGYLESSNCVMEIGSGPGTYSMELAPRVRIIVCMDTSPRMLQRLKDSAEARGLTNIERYLKDWNTYEPAKGYDACIATLCPGSGTPDSIARMEGTARNYCILVSWVRNHGDDLNADIWKYLGKDYGYDFRGSTQVEDWLKDNGRDPQVEFFDTTIDEDILLEKLVAKETSAFAAYGVRIDMESAIRDILGDQLDGDILHYHAVNRMKMIVWKSR